MSVIALTVKKQQRKLIFRLLEILCFYIKKYLFSFLSKLYNQFAIISILIGGIIGSLAIFLILNLILRSVAINPILRVFMIVAFPFFIIATLILTCMLDDGVGKNKVESVNKNIEEKLEILKNKKLLESRIKGSYGKNNDKKYL